MAGERTLKVTILGDADKLRGAFGDAGREADGFGTKMSGAAKTVGLAVAGMSAGGLVIAKNAVSAASDLAEVQSKTKVIFGSASKDIETFASNAARDFGQTKTQAMNAATTFATFGKAAGLQNRDLTDFSTKMTGLASDLASFHNTKPEEAVEALGAALRGESEPLRKYGVMLDDASLKAQAMKMGIYDGNGALTQQQKTLAAYELILSQTKDAQGDFSRTSDGLANQQRIVSAEFGNLSTKIGGKLLPAMSGIVGFAGDILKAWDEDGFRGVISKIVDVFQELWPKVKEKLGDLLGALGRWVVDSGPEILRQLGEWTVKFVQWAGDMIPPLLEKLGALLAAVFTWISDNRDEIFTKLGEWTGKFIDWVGDVLVKVLEKLPGITSAIIGWIGDNAPGILLELAKWTGSFLAFAGGLAIDLIAKLVTDVLPALLRWIADVALDVATELLKWTGQFLAWAASMVTKLPGALADVTPKLLGWIAEQVPKVAEKLLEWTGKFLGWVADMTPQLVTKLGEVAVALLKWVVDVAPDLLAKLGEWTAQFLAWGAKASLALHAWAVEHALDFIGWIVENAAKLPGQLLEWTKEFIGWAGGVGAAIATAIAGGAISVVKWIGDQAANLPGQLVHWTTQFTTWVGGLAGAIGGALTDFAGNLAEAIWEFLKDRISGIFSGNGGVGGNNQGVTQNGQKIRFQNGRWVYDGGPKDGQPVPASELSSQQQAMQAGGTGGGGGGGGGPAPTNSQGGGGQTLAQMFAAGMTPQQVAERTGLPLDVVQANYIVWQAGQAAGSVLGGDHDDENDGDLTPAGPGESNLTGNAIKMRRDIQSTFDGYASIGGYAYRTTAAGTPSDHATGKALDVMMRRLHDPLGDRIAGWAIGQDETKYVIWDNQIWSRSKPYWRDYATSGKVGAANQGSATGRHEDHVHISVLGRGGVVKARQGGTLALLGEAGQDEAVVPLPAGREAGFGNVYVTVHVHGNVMRERDLALTIRDELIRAKREGVTIGLG